MIGLCVVRGACIVRQDGPDKCSRSNARGLDALVQPDGSFLQGADHRYDVGGGCGSMLPRRFVVADTFRVFFVCVVCVVYVFLLLFFVDLGGGTLFGLFFWGWRGG